MPKLEITWKISSAYPVNEVNHKNSKSIPCIDYEEEVLQNMYCISSAIYYIIIEVSQNIPIFTYYVILAYMHALKCIFRDN